jgi:arylsulfatase
MDKHFFTLTLGLFVGTALISVAAAQETTVPGSPGATTTIDGRYLPPPPQPFGGEIDTNADQSKPYWPELVVPPKGAPNILLIMTDDVGFSAPSTFGGVIPTPALDRVAQMGLHYTRFHTTALCSPTRAALLTGRNHHSVATGVVVDQATGYPGYNSVIPRDAVAIGEILHQNGYDSHGTARITTCRNGRGARPVPSITGRLAPSKALTITMASSATTRVSGSRTICSATPRRSSLISAILAGT